MMNEPRLLRQVEQHPYPLLFATISGAHLYGFPSPDSDFDLRGCHVLPTREVVGLDSGRETVEASTMEGGFEVDLVTHDARKFFGLLLKKNGYVLEQLYSPLVVHTTPEHEELKAVAAMIKSNERLAMKLTSAVDIKKDIEAVYKAGMEINYLPSMPSAASIYDKPLK